MLIIELVRYIWMSNACVKFEERSLNPWKLSRWQRNCDAAAAAADAAVADAAAADAAAAAAADAAAALLTKT